MSSKVQAQTKAQCESDRVSASSVRSTEKKQTSLMKDSWPSKPVPFQPYSASCEYPNEVPSIVHNVLRSPGKPLDSNTLTLMKSRFNHDFSHVRVHTDDRAAASARTVNALAYTVGRKVVLGTGNGPLRTIGGQRLLAHELTHVLQQRRFGDVEPESVNKICMCDDPLERQAAEFAVSVSSGRRFTDTIGGTLLEPCVQRIGFIEAIRRFFGGGNFSEQELLDYLAVLEGGQIEDHYDSDNKAREVVRRWKAGDAAFMVLTIPIRILLVREMASGYLSGDDQEGILDLLEECITSERTTVIREAGVTSMRTRFDRGNRRRLDQLLEEHQLDVDLALLGTGWDADGVMQIMHRHGDEHIIRTILDENLHVLQFDTLFITYEYNDGRIEEEEATNVRGSQRGHDILIRSNLTNEEAAEVLYHEVTHYNISTIPDRNEEEIRVRIETEEFKIRHGLPATPGYRNPDGTVNQQAIRSDVASRPHYNPQLVGRSEISRRYVPDPQREVTGWRMP